MVSLIRMEMDTKKGCSFFFKCREGCGFYDAEV